MLQELKRKMMSNMLQLLLSVCTSMYTFLRTVTFWVEMLYELPPDTKHLMKRVCLDVPVTMNFQSNFGFEAWRTVGCTSVIKQ